jgi:hypothetical protein
VVNGTAGPVSIGNVCGGCGEPRREGAWCPICLERYEPRDPTLGQGAGVPPVRPIRPPHVVSRTKAGPTSFGLVGRLVLSIVPALVAFVAVRNVMRSRHDPTVAYYLVLAVPTLVLVVGFLAFVWRKERIG